MCVCVCVFDNYSFQQRHIYIKNKIKNIKTVMPCSWDKKGRAWWKRDACDYNGCVLIDVCFIALDFYGRGKIHIFGADSKNIFIGKINKRSKTRDSSGI